MYCQQCGSEIQGDAKFCANCGEKVMAEPPKSSEEKQINLKPKNENSESPNQYNKYCARVKKINNLSIALYILAMIAAIMLVAMPIYTRTYEPSLEDIDSWDQFGEALQNGGVLKENFSVIDDVVEIVNYFVDDEDSEGYGNNYGENYNSEVNRKKSDTETLQVIVIAIIPIMELVWVIVLFYYCISKIIKMFKERDNIDKTTMLKYNEMKGVINDPFKANVLFRKGVSGILCLTLFAIYDVVFMFLFDMIGLTVSVRKYQTLSGLSALGYLTVSLLIAVLVIHILRKKENQAMLDSITEENYSKE